MATTPSKEPRAIKRRLKQYSALTPAQAHNGHRPLIHQDLQWAASLEINDSAIPTLSDWLKGPIDWEPADQQLAALRFSENEPLVLANYGKRTKHFRIEPGCETELEIDLSESVGFVTGVSRPVPGEWSPEWNYGDWAQTYGASNDHIRCNRFIYLECDNGDLSVDQQRAIVERAGLPHPSLICHSGSRSCHFYWNLAEELTANEFRAMQKGLAKLIATIAPEFKVDASLSNPSRVMRLAGSIHPKTGQRCRILTDNRQAIYPKAAIQALLPQIEVGTAPGGAQVFSQWDGVDALQLLPHIPADPSPELLQKLDGRTSYQYWCAVGMAIHWCGLDCEVWDAWSEPHPAYEEGACERKWASFSEDGNGRTVTLGFLVWVAREASGFQLKLDPSSLTSDWIQRGREKTRLFREAQLDALQVEKERLKSLPEWEKEWDWQLSPLITIEVHIKGALLRRAEFEERPIVFVDNAFRRYDPGKGYFVAVPENLFRKELSEYLTRAYRLVGKQQSKDYAFSTENYIKRCYSWLRSDLTQDENSFKPNRLAIACRNGTLYFEPERGEWRLGEHSADNCLTHSIDASVRLGAACPEVFSEFVRTSYGLQWLEIVRAVVNYTVDPRARCLFILHLLGRSGSGKGALLKVLEATTPTDCLQTLGRFEEINSITALAQTVLGKRMVVFPDVQGTQKGVTNLYRLCDSRERMSARPLYGGACLSFEFTGRVMCASTEPIRVDSAGSGLPRRLFTLKSLEQPLASALLPQDRTNSGALENLLIAHLGDIIGWALAMPKNEVDAVLNRRDPEGLLAATSRAVTAGADSGNLFIDGCLEPADLDSTVATDSVFSAYRLFCVHTGMKTCGKNTFLSRLKESMPHLHQARVSAPGSSGAQKIPARFVGFRLRESLWNPVSDLPYSEAEKEEAFNYQRSPRGCDWGCMDTRHIGEGGLADLLDHRRAELELKC